MTEKPKPKDYDACWEPDGVVIGDDVIFLEDKFSTAKQKLIYGGEYYSAKTQSRVEDRLMLDFFQFTYENIQKGILRINISNDEMLQGIG